MTVKKVNNKPKAVKHIYSPPPVNKRSLEDIYRTIDAESRKLSF